MRTNEHSNRTISNCYESAALSQQQVDRFGIFGSNTATTTATKNSNFHSIVKQQQQRFTASLDVSVCWCVVVDVRRINRTKVLAQIFWVNEKCSGITCVLCEIRISSIQSVFHWCFLYFVVRLTVLNFSICLNCHSNSPSASTELTYNIFNFNFVHFYDSIKINLIQRILVFALDFHNEK